MTASLTNPRSSWPYITILSLLLTPMCMLTYLFTYQTTTNELSDGSTVFETQATGFLPIIALAILVVGVGYTVFMAIRTLQYQKIHPNVSFRALLFADSRDDDEMLTAMTGHASRVALGVSELATILLVGLFMWHILPANAFWIVTMLSISLIGTMITYALSMRKAASA